MFWSHKTFKQVYNAHISEPLTVSSSFSGNQETASVSSVRKISSTSKTSTSTLAGEFTRYKRERTRSGEFTRYTKDITPDMTVLKEKIESEDNFEDIQASNDLCTRDGHVYGHRIDSFDGEEKLMITRKGERFCLKTGIYDTVLAKIDKYWCTIAVLCHPTIRHVEKVETFSTGEIVTLTNDSKYQHLILYTAEGSIIWDYKTQHVVDFDVTNDDDICICKCYQPSSCIVVISRFGFLQQVITAVLEPIHVSCGYPNHIIVESKGSLLIYHKSGQLVFQRRMCQEQFHKIHAAACGCVFCMTDGMFVVFNCRSYSELTFKIRYAENTRKYFFLDSNGCVVVPIHRHKFVYLFVGHAIHGFIKKCPEMNIYQIDKRLLKRPLHILDYLDLQHNSMKKNQRYTIADILHLDTNLKTVDWYNFFYPVHDVNGDAQQYASSLCRTIMSGSDVDTALSNLASINVGGNNNLSQSYVLLFSHILMAKSSIDLGKANAYGFSPLHWAIFNSNTLLLRLLIQNGLASHMSNTQIPPLSLSVMFASKETTNLLLIAIAKTFTQKYGLHKIELAWKQETNRNFKIETKQRRISGQWMYEITTPEFGTGFAMIVWSGFAVSNEQIQTQQFMGLDVIYRLNRYVSDEGRVVSAEESKRIATDQISPFLTSIQIDSLFKKHSNLNIVRFSYKKSVRYGSENSEIISCPTVELYCTVKGYSPVWEEEFPPYINGVVTDVREGFFIHGTGHGSSDFMSHLKVGSCISSSICKSGTLGGFVEDQGNLSFITCAHVMFGLQELLSSPLPSGRPAYQPALDSSGIQHTMPAECGTVEKSVFDPGAHFEVGVDAALVRVSSRHPIDGSMPRETTEKLEAAGYDPHNPPVVHSGDILPREVINGNDLGNNVIKFGAQTGLTRGILKVQGTHVRIENKELALIEPSSNPFVPNERRVIMHNQLEVLPVGDYIFFQPGDSGAFVFMMMNNDPHDLKCIGMAVGCTTNGHCVVTPISNVLQKLNLPLRLHLFHVPGASNTLIAQGQPTVHYSRTNAQVSQSNDIASTLSEIIKRELRPLRRSNEILKARIRSLERRYQGSRKKSYSGYAKYTASTLEKTRRSYQHRSSVSGSISSESAHSSTQYQEPISQEEQSDSDSNCKSSGIASGDSDVLDLCESP